jgi:hypothetical protein
MSNTIHFEGGISTNVEEQARIREAIRRIEGRIERRHPTWIVVSHRHRVRDGVVYIAHAVRRDWTVTAESVDELVEKLDVLAESGWESGHAVQGAPFDRATVPRSKTG